LSKPKILITGINGLLGPYLKKAASKYGQVAGLSRSSKEYPCDLKNKIEVQRVIRDFRPDIVLHAAAMTDVDECEKNPDEAELVNHEATRTLSELLFPDTYMVFFSTIAVYPNSVGPHTEGTENPVNVYGRTKLSAEKVALKRKKSLILRTTLIGKSLVSPRISLTDFIINNLKDKKLITLFSDVLFSPLHTSTLAELTMQAIDKGLSGVYNASTIDGVSKSEFGYMVAKKYGLDTDKIIVDSSKNILDRAPRSLDSRLDPSLLEDKLLKKMPLVLDEINKL